MERDPCPICSKSFSNGKALGGHMRAHLAFHPLPPKPQELEDLNKANPSMRLRSREGKDQDDSSNKSPEKVTGKRPRQCKSIDAVVDVPTKVKTPGLVSVPSPIEDVALSLMMLYNGEWKNDIEEKQKGKRGMRQDNTINEDETKKGNNDNGNEEYTFYPAMAWTKIQTQMVTRTKAQAVACDKGSQSDPMLENPEAIEAQLRECESCPKVFKSRQALGGLMKIHASSSSNYAIRKHNLIDLNLPPPEGDDEIN